MEYSEALGASYRLGEPIGSGAAGQVWRAVDVRSGETVAAKILRPEHLADPTLVERFVRERSILTGLQHPNIVTVRDLVVEGDRLAIVMDYVAGGSLRDVLATYRNLPPQVATGLAAEVLEGIAAAHRRDVSHRDIKPDNVLLMEDWLTGRSDGAKVTDFGIARIVTERPRTSTGLLGTPEYMSPELISSGVAGPEADVYGAGVLLYEMLAGRTPFAGPGTDFTVAYRHVSSQVPSLDVPTDLGALLHRMLAKDPRARPTAADAAVALHRLSAALTDVPELPLQTGPEEFTQTERPATAIRGIDESQTESAGAGGEAPGPGTTSLPDLGAPVGATMHRPMPRRPAPVAEVAEESIEEPAPRVWWKRPWVIAAGVGALILIIVLTVVLIKVLPRPKPPPEQKSAPPVIQATQQDQATPTGLGISRKAEYDPSSATIKLTITYTAQKAPLSGPFFEVIPGLPKQSGCPTVSWTDGAQKENLPSVTGITQRCGWSIDGVDVEKQNSQEVSVDVHQKITDQSQLQDWLDAAGQATTDAMSDSDVSGTAYPVQRLQDIQVNTPSRIVSQRTLPITLVPVWPSGEDAVNPLYKSPAVGQPSEMLTAVAGGEDGVRFSDGCSGALTVSSDGLTVTALSQAPECTVNAQVGNFTDLTSSPFAVVTRGG
ncbi:serine/threonine-protein kinase [Microlunatus soli]|uniref:non-specific serine/threonine protein kinase n=1 Tax=Microlunatus soli TaxID=630515 RepID=A0A1H1XD79_9ACTN|nr:serine/threonine-protein kinase [Microlunatus soli]SDT07278.1 serine/threonine protein kinase [Microlunatus soli]